MSYFDDAENVNSYIKMTDGADGSHLVNLLKKYLHRDAGVLELGMGPGKDLDMLSESFQVTGSDNSQVFLDLYRERNASADLLFLDAVTLDTQRKFNCIYSNKVLHHLTRGELKHSFQRQWRILKNDGVVLHSFWLGDKEEEMHGLRFVYYTETSIQEVIGKNWQIVEFETYTELSDDDSFYIVLKKLSE